MSEGFPGKEEAPVQALGCGGVFKVFALRGSSKVFIILFKDGLQNSSHTFMPTMPVKRLGRSQGSGYPHSGLGGVWESP